jgi:hypothetical protein
MEKLYYIDIYRGKQIKSMIQHLITYLALHLFHMMQLYGQVFFVLPNSVTVNIYLKLIACLPPTFSLLLLVLIKERSQAR